MISARTRMLCLLILAVCCASAYCDEPARADDGSRLYAFGEHLFSEGEYYRAITEYMRLLFFYPDHNLAQRAQIRIGAAYQMGEQWDDAITHFQRVADRGTDELLNACGAFELAVTCYLQGKYALAANEFDFFLEDYAESPLADRARYLRGWAYLDAGRYEKAIEAFREVEPGSPYGVKAKLLAGEIAKIPNLPKKSPTLAGIISGVIPGGGQVYVGRILDAGLTLLVNAVLIAAAVESFGAGIPIVGGIVAFIESGFYIGNIFGAITGANKRNLDARNEFVANLHTRAKFRLEAATESAMLSDLLPHPIVP